MFHSALNKFIVLCNQWLIMSLNVSAKCFVKQETGFLVDESGNKLQSKSMVTCWITLFIITAEGDIDHFTWSKMENIYQADERYFNSLEGEVRELKEEKNQSILVSAFRALTGSRCRTRRRHVTGIPPTLVTLESTPVSHLKVGATMQPTPSKMEQDESVLEQLDPIPTVEVVRQPSVDNQLGGSYITEMQVQNDSCQVSVCNLNSEAQEYLKNHFNEH